MDNGDGTLSVFATALDTAALIAPPRSGTPATCVIEPALGSISRLLAANATGRGARYRPGGNVELVLRDPRR